MIDEAALIGCLISQSQRGSVHSEGEGAGCQRQESRVRHGQLQCRHSQCEEAGGTHCQSGRLRQRPRSVGHGTNNDEGQ